MKFVKGNFLPGRIFVDIVDFQEQLNAWNTDIADIRIHGTTHERPIDRRGGSGSLDRFLTELSGSVRAVGAILSLFSTLVNPHPQ